MNFTDDTRKHLEFLQNIITRMNTNSFQIKGMAVTIVSAFLALYASTQKVMFIFISVIPTILFWFLDSYYLQQERKFRGIYKDVAGLNETNPVRPYEMPIQNYKGNGYSYGEVLWSPTIAWLYVVLIVVVIALGLVAAYFIK